MVISTLWSHLEVFKILINFKSLREVGSGGFVGWVSVGGEHPSNEWYKQRRKLQSKRKSRHKKLSDHWRCLLSLSRHTILSTYDYTTIIYKSVVALCDKKSIRRMKRSRGSRMNTFSGWSWLKPLKQNLPAGASLNCTPERKEISNSFPARLQWHLKNTPPTWTTLHDSFIHISPTYRWLIKQTIQIFPTNPSWHWVGFKFFQH